MYVHGCISATPLTALQIVESLKTLGIAAEDTEMFVVTVDMPAEQRVWWCAVVWCE